MRGSKGGKGPPCDSGEQLLRVLIGARELAGVSCSFWNFRCRDSWRYTERCALALVKAGKAGGRIASPPAATRGPCYYHDSRLYCPETPNLDGKPPEGRLGHGFV